MTSAADSGQRPQITALVGCQNVECATETSYHLNMVRLWDKQPICEECYSQLNLPDWAPWWPDLPNVTLDMLVE